MMDRSCDAKVLLVRHPQVHERLRGVCYGRSDVPLSLQGRQQSLHLAQQLARLPVTYVVHSGLERTRLLAARLGRFTGVKPESEPALAERDFGGWELQMWNEIYKRHGDEMMKMVTDPDTYRPGGGETTSEMADRAWNWFQSRQARGLTVVISHGGPIAACVGRHRELPVAEWAELIPSCGDSVCINPAIVRGSV